MAPCDLDEYIRSFARCLIRLSASILSLPSCGAEALSRKAGYVGAIGFSRTGDLATADFGDANVIRKFGQGGKGRYERLLFRRCRPILARDPGPVR